MFKWSNGVKYEGGYKGGRKEGEGVLTFADGTCFKGKWIKGCFQK